MPNENPCVPGAYVKIECMLRPRTDADHVECTVTLRKKPGAGQPVRVSQTNFLLDSGCTEQLVAAHVSSALRELSARIL